jgi:hypothetical protein
MDPRDLGSFRCCSKTYNAIVRDILFDDFTFLLRPTSRHICMLEELPTSPWVMSRLRNLKLETGIPLEYADYRYWQAEVYQARTSQWRLSRLSHITFQDYASFHKALQARFSPELQRKYDLFRWHLDREAASATTNRYAWRLAVGLQALKAHIGEVNFVVSMKEPEITLEQVEAFDPGFHHDGHEVLDPQRRVQMRRHSAKAHMANFLAALHLSGIDVKNLRLDNVPPELLGPAPFLAMRRPNGDIGVARSAFNNVPPNHLDMPPFDRFDQREVFDLIIPHLNNLEVSFRSLPYNQWLDERARRALEAWLRINDIHDGPHDNAVTRAMRHLYEVLDQAQDLRRFRFRPEVTEEGRQIHIRDFGDMSRRTVSFDRLTHLQLEGIRFELVDLELILRQDKGLHSLVLLSCALQSSVGRDLNGPDSMYGLIRALRSRGLKSAEISKELLVNEGVWHLHSQDDYSLCPLTEGAYPKESLKSRVHAYITGASNICPLPELKTHDEPVNCQILELWGDNSFHFVPR